MNTPLHGSAKWLRLVAIGGALTALAGTFAYAGGWLGAPALTPQRIIDTFEAQAGHHPGYRKNHAKGLCVAGRFLSSGQAASLSTARVFSQAEVPVIGRFAIGGANPFAPDTAVPTRSLALDLRSDDGQTWRTGMNNPPVLAVSTAQGFYDQVLANTPDPATGKPDPARQQAFFAAHPETAAWRRWAASYKPSDSFASTAYHSINAFVLVDARGNAQPVRWQLVPQAPFQPLPAQVDDKQFLQHDLQRRLAQGPLRWTLRLTLAEAGDAVDDPAQQWPAERRSIDAGTLLIERVEGPEQGACRDLNFDPLILPSGIKASADPILAARSAAYAVSFDRRSRETLSPGTKP
ncbi:catalase family peroxidase [Pseudomonas sp. UBA6562]|uniref:catalase family peroxidase n=1 Tax=Pseudomonas sp. UBA6562 TaxID=1947332 RepID=UPI0025D1FEE9|nr:catalase family peroxidase [Pseudomonas sp. UBA6562]